MRHLFLIPLLIFFTANGLLAKSNCVCPKYPKDLLYMLDDEVPLPFNYFGPNIGQKVGFCGNIEDRINNDETIVSYLMVFECDTGKVLINTVDHENGSYLCKIINNESSLKIDCWSSYTSYSLKIDSSLVRLSRTKLPSKGFKKRKNLLVNDDPQFFRRIGLPGYNEANAWPLTLKNIKTEKKLYLGKQIIFEDGSKTEFGFTPEGILGYEIYKRGQADIKKSSEIDYSKNQNLIGISIQYFPDCSDEELGYTGEYPTRIIYVYRNGKASSLLFYPDGTPRIIDKDGPTYFDGRDILLFQ
jgi:hypothetical protein